MQPAEIAALIRSSDSMIFPPHSYKPIPGPSSSPNSPDLELFAGSSSFAPDGKAVIIGMGIVLLRYVVCLGSASRTFGA